MGTQEGDEMGEVLYLLMVGWNVLTSAGSGYTEYLPAAIFRSEEQAEEAGRVFAQKRIIPVPLCRDAHTFNRYRAWGEKIKEVG